jgi:tetratricopeptide (TPR) repeat protein
MSLTIEELISKSREQRSQTRLEEALVSALAAVRLDEGRSDAWWQLALCRLALDDTDKAIVALEKVVDLDTEANIAWTRLGECYLEKNKLSEAKHALLTARELNEDNVSTLEALSQVYLKENNETQDPDEITVLEQLFSFSSLSNGQLNRLGILFYKNNKYHEAIKYWSFEIDEETDPARSFNLGLAFNSEVIARPLDAIDVWRMTLFNWPSYEKAKSLLDTNISKVIDVQRATLAKTNICYLSKDDWYSNYINPFILLNVSGVDSLDDFDSKLIVKLRKTLLQEIELENEHVSWIDGIAINKSRAISIVDELNDNTKRNNHWNVFQDKPLLRFLTNGSLEHFLVTNDTDDRISSLLNLKYDEDYKSWLSPIFARQFGRVLSKAIQNKDCSTIKMLMSGRNWSESADIDEALAGARRAISILIAPLSDLLNRSENERARIKIDELTNRVESSGLLPILNLLPNYFEEQQREVVSAVRLIGINAFNNHNDLSISNRAIELSKAFKYAPISLKQRLEDDVKSLAEIDARERKDEVHLTMGKTPLKITREGASHGEKYIAADAVETLRWGILVGIDNGRRYHDFLFEITDAKTDIFLSWRGVTDIDAQQKHFSSLINASLTYLADHIVKNAISKVKRGETVTVGPCKMSITGISFEDKGWFFSDTKTIAWHNANFAIDNGDVIVTDKTNRKARVQFPLRGTDNAFLPNALSLRMGAHI